MTPEEAMSQSRTDFEKIVWPAIAKELGGGVLRPIEGEPGHLERDLDVVCSIDYIQEVPYARRPLSTRVQWGKDYRTWTIRKMTRFQNPTEYDKLGLAVGGMRPFWTIQAYVSDDRSRLLSAAAINTVDLIELAHQGRWVYREDMPVPGGNRMNAIAWKTAIACGKAIIIWPHSADQIGLW